MGLLATLDLHKRLQTGETKKYAEIEYQLFSWGEIFPPFLGNREHSLAARYILRDFPFKLFSASTPYEALPQKLCLTFRAPEEVKVDKETLKVSGFYQHETVEEFTAFLSLITRRRILVSKQTRYDNLPIEEEMPYRQPHLQMRQRLKEIDPNKIYQLLDNLQGIDRRIGNSFILAALLYHSAIEMLYTEPEFAYLFLIMSLEAISSAVYSDLRPSDIENGYTDRYLNSAYPGWHRLCDISTHERKSEAVKMLLTPAYITFRKLSKFVEGNTPEHFWSETEDDAKPDYYYQVITPEIGPNGVIKPSFELKNHVSITDMEKIEKKDLMKVLRNIYSVRSRLIHEGMRLPRSIVIGLLPRIPVEAVDEMTGCLTEEKQLPIPPILTFERLVSYSMVEFLSKRRAGSDDV